MKDKVRRIHMVGIGGSGMSGIAEVLLNLGYRVSGSDLSESGAVEQLRQAGARVCIGHDPDNVEKAEVVVKSTAIDEDNAELVRAREKSIPVIPRAEMLAELMRLKTGIAVAGTHGKTSTTSFLGTIFKEAGLDPTVIIGGRLNSYGSNALPGRGDFLIAEADESDKSFLCLFPIMNVVTNVDADHLDHYRDLQEIKDVFVQFMNSVPFYGINVVCGDDPGVMELIPRVKRPVMTYGVGPGNRLQARDIVSSTCSEFEIFLDREKWSRVRLSQPGRHNILNALAAVGISIVAGLPREKIVAGLELFGGVGRRFEVKGEKNGVLVIDDYGHHPTEIRATLETARQCYPGRRLVVLFQPHRFTRTRALFGDFCSTFQDVDRLLLTEIYPASEAPIPGVNGLSLSQGIRQVSQTEVDFVQDFDAAFKALLDILQPGDVFITQGAGSVWRVGERFLNRDACL
ncbi:MAG: UDP-N-acetylmuramate--L-alanine ligase [Desulfonatronovibrionaceae bacterium]